MINNIITFLISLTGSQMFIIFMLVIIVIVGIVAFKFNYTQQIRVSLFIDDECEIFNKDGIIRYIKGHKRKFKKPSLLAVKITNLSILYNSTISDKHQMMMNITDCMLRGLGTYEMVGKCAGNIFIIVLDDKSKDSIKALCQKIDERLLGLRFSDYGSYNFINLYAVNTEANLSDVDVAVTQTLSAFEFSNVQDGNIYFYSDVVDSAMNKFSEINSLKDSALEEHRFQAYIQPKVSLETGKTVGGEMLCRWLSNSGEILYNPSEFVPIFESNGFIKKIDFEMFEQACQLVQNLIQRGYDDIIISVNLSKINFESKTFIEDLTNIISKYNAPPKNIEIEITETTTMMNASYVSQCIMKLRNLGFHLAMDDFGKEFSSLGALSNSPFDTIKMDMVFFQNKLSIDKEQKIANSLIDMLEELGLEIVCEGIEDEKTLEQLASISTKIVVQGYVYSKPVPVSRFEEFLKTTFHHDFIDRIREEKELEAEKASQVKDTRVASAKASRTSIDDISDDDIDEIEAIKRELIQMRQSMEEERINKAKKEKLDKLRKLRDELAQISKPTVDEEDPYDIELRQLREEIESIKAGKKTTTEAEARAIEKENIKKVSARKASPSGEEE